MAALLLQANKTVSKTDRICSWSNTSGASQEERSIKEMYPLKQEYNPIDRDVTDEDKSFFLNGLKQLNRFSGFYWLLQEEPSSQKSPIMTFHDALQATTTQDSLLEKLKIQSDQVAEIAKLTIGQRNNALYPPSLFARFSGTQKLDGVRSIQWGINNELAAVQEFEDAMKLKVQPTGLWLHPSGVLGASPDGLVGDNAIIEVKCPYKHMNSSREEIVADKGYCLDENFNIKITHEYYDQIQGQLSLTNRDFCFFVVWTLKNVVINQLERNYNWELSNIKKLENFYKEKLLPTLMA